MILATTSEPVSLTRSWRSNFSNSWRDVSLASSFPFWGLAFSSFPSFATSLAISSGLMSLSASRRRLRIKSTTLNPSFPLVRTRRSSLVWRTSTFLVVSWSKVLSKDMYKNSFSKDWIFAAACFENASTSASFVVLFSTQLSNFPCPASAACTDEPLPIRSCAFSKSLSSIFLWVETWASDLAFSKAAALSASSFSFRSFFCCFPFLLLSFGVSTGSFAFISSIFFNSSSFSLRNCVTSTVSGSSSSSSSDLLQIVNDILMFRNLMH